MNNYNKVPSYITDWDDNDEPGYSFEDNSGTAPVSSFSFEPTTATTKSNKRLLL